MSAAKMVADSTQADVPELSGTKKRKKMVQKKKVKKKKEKDTSKKMKKKMPEREFDESDLDLEKEIHPIGYFVKDREGLLEELFHCVKGPSMERALPDVLQVTIKSPMMEADVELRDVLVYLQTDLPVDDLKQRCLQQLLVMSKKRIRRILAGDDPSTISSSGTEDDTSEEELQEMEEGEDEAHVVDSTSLYEQTMELSDRPVNDDDYDDDSMVHSTLSPYPSDTERQYQHQYEEESDQEYQSGNDYLDHEESESNSRQSVIVKEDPEEGEVFDDSDEELGSNVRVVIDSREVYEGSDDNESASNGEAITDGKEVLGGDTDTINASDVVNKPKCADQDVTEAGEEMADADVKVANADDVVSNAEQEVVSVDGEVVVPDKEIACAEGVVAGDNEVVDNADVKVVDAGLEMAETKTDTESNLVANMDQDMKVEEIKTSEGEASESINVTADNKRVHKDESVELDKEPDKSGELQTDIQDVSVDENAVEISIRDLDDERFVEETGEMSESGQSDGELTDEEIIQPDKTEVKSSEVKAREVKSSEVKAREVKSSEVKAREVKSSEANANAVKARQVKASAVKASSVKASVVKASVLKASTVKASEGTSSVQMSQPPPRRIVKPPSQDIAPALTKNQMELLELEMRARAIKAMLKTAK